MLKKKKINGHNWTFPQLGLQHWHNLFTHSGFILDSKSDEGFGVLDAKKNHLKINFDGKQNSLIGIIVFCCKGPHHFRIVHRRWLKLLYAICNAANCTVGTTKMCWGRWQQRIDIWIAHQTIGLRWCTSMGLWCLTSWTVNFFKN